MTTRLRVEIPGEPVAKGRPRTRVVPGAKPFARIYTPSETIAYEKHVRTLAQLAVNQQRWAPPKNARFRLLITVYRTHEGRGGDADNYAKGISDALNGVAFEDDRYVRDLAVMLRQDAERPRVGGEVGESEGAA